MKRILVVALFLAIILYGCKDSPSSPDTPSEPAETPVDTSTPTETPTPLIQPWGMTTTAAPYDGRHDFGGCTLNGYMWVIGGSSEDIPSGDGDVWRSSDGANWTQVTAYGDVPALGRWGHSVVSHMGYMYVVAGGNAGDKDNVVWRSANGTDWESVTLNAQWGGRSDTAVLSYDNKLWVIGGYDGGYLNDVWYSTDGGDWTAATLNAEFQGRYDHAAVVHNGEMWIMGGFGYGCNNPFGSWTMNDVWKSSDGALWTNTACLAPFYLTRNSVLLSYGGKLWAVGALYAAGAVPADEDEVWWTTDGSSWTKENVTTFTVRSRHVGFIFDPDAAGPLAEQMWITGGGLYSQDRYNDTWYTELTN